MRRRNDDDGPVHVSEILPDVLDRIFSDRPTRPCLECHEWFEPETRFEQVCARCVQPEAGEAA